ncbi:MAG: PepSY-like domain-containing protein [Saprospiraceae bacterium]
MRVLFLVLGILSFTACTELTNIVNNDRQDDMDSSDTITLPDVVSNYITINYPNYIVEESEYDMTCDSTEVIEVELEMGNDEIELIFDMEGNFLHSALEIDSANLPIDISNSIITNFSSYTLDNEAEELIMADGSLQYEVELKGTQDELEVLFASDGTVLCQEVDND